MLHHFITLYQHDLGRVKCVIQMQLFIYYGIFEMLHYYWHVHYVYEKLTALKFQTLSSQCSGFIGLLVFKMLVRLANLDNLDQPQASS